MHFKCVKNKTKWEVHLYMSKNLWQTHNEKAWMLYDSADSWDALLSKIERRRYTRFCCQRSKDSFDRVTNLMYDCVKSYSWRIV